MSSPRSTSPSWAVSVPCSSAPTISYRTSWCGGASMLSRPLRDRIGDPQRTLQVIYVAATVSCAMLALGLFVGWVITGTIVFILMAMLQNARRPVFVSQLNRVMDKPQRATTLSHREPVANVGRGGAGPSDGARRRSPWARLGVRHDHRDPRRRLRVEPHAEGGAPDVADSRAGQRRMSSLRVITPSPTTRRAKYTPGRTSAARADLASHLRSRRPAGWRSSARIATRRPATS